jgi:Nucleotidyl transferase AbiEii toxin, Type IV TA system
VDPNLVLTRFAAERFLYRLSLSRHADRFVLKGALMLVVWLGEMTRPTRDTDLLGFGDLSDESLRGIFTDVCTLSAEGDGLTFDPASIEIAAIRREDPYGGKRATFDARLGAARLRLQVDIGIGDSVFPEPQWLDYPSLLDLPRPHLRGYCAETAISEKVHAMVTLGSKNSRMRDFFDVHALAARTTFDRARLTRAVRSTFERRQTAIPDELPLALTPAFAEIEGKSAQWVAFLKRSRLVASENELEPIIRKLTGFLGPVLEAARTGQSLSGQWPPGGPWRSP